ncbi:MAG: Carbon monoxide dehydrogenase subunit G [Candidatus Tokpelaia hoelldobleri]|uniref:Carbon monoxide dehydrogenase subunit G n=1 Tax=Candidatus Tokpelaia hoelldobleri TaxID=1902579 RepID=A0A1U9JW78_9HYPH|nr:MAG: Carbon monoxide dehydrogenase subunit G [Candidatus Tokpelaia hoelldoblerii]
MEIEGQEIIAAPREAVWHTLNDTTLLIDCIPGCEKLERISPSCIEAVLAVKLGVIRLRFRGRLVLSDMKPPCSYTISGEGEGAMSGLATGKTDVELIDKGGHTELRYVMRGHAEGKLASLGSKLLVGVARKITNRFFANVAEIAGGLA